MTAERAAFAEQQDTEQYARGAGPTPRQRPPGPSPTRHAHPQRGPHTGRPSPSRYQTAPRPKQAPSTGSTGGSRVCPRADSYRLYGVRLHATLSLTVRATCFAKRVWRQLAGVHLLIGMCAKYARCSENF